MTGSGGAAGPDPLACCVDLHRFVMWRGTVAVLAVAAVATLALWGASMPAELQPGAPWIASLAAIGVAALALLLFRVDAGTLCRAAGAWTFEPRSASPGDGAQAGHVAVALDLGNFMLLVFTEHPRAGRRRWLPVERRGLERDWQRLRTAVHAPRPAEGAGVAVPE